MNYICRAEQRISVYKYSELEKKYSSISKPFIRTFFTVKYRHNNPFLQVIHRGKELFVKKTDIFRFSEKIPEDQSSYAVLIRELPENRVLPAAPSPKTQPLNSRREITTAPEKPKEQKSERNQKPNSAANKLRNEEAKKNMRNRKVREQEVEMKLKQSRKGVPPAAPKRRKGRQLKNKKKSVLRTNTLKLNVPKISITITGADKTPWRSSNANVIEIMKHGIQDSTSIPWKKSIDVKLDMKVGELRKMLEEFTNKSYVTMELEQKVLSDDTKTISEVGIKPESIIDIGESGKHNLFAAATGIQAAYRGYKNRKEFLKKHKAATKIQTAYRGYRGYKIIKLYVNTHEKLSWTNSLVDKNYTELKKSNRKNLEKFKKMLQDRFEFSRKTSRGRSVQTYEDKECEFETATFGKQETRLINKEVVIAEPVTAHETLKNTENIEGKVVIAQRGKGPFLDKAFYAYQAGAIGLIIINDNSDENNSDELFRIGTEQEHFTKLIEKAKAKALTDKNGEPITETYLKTMDIPIIFISQKDGKILTDMVENPVAADIEHVPPQPADDPGIRAQPLTPQEIVPDLHVALLSDTKKKGVVIRRSKQQARVDFSSSGGPSSKWVNAKELCRDMKGEVGSQAPMSPAPAFSTTIGPPSTDTPSLNVASPEPTAKDVSPSTPQPHEVAEVRVTIIYDNTGSPKVSSITHKELTRNMKSIDIRDNETIKELKKELLKHVEKLPSGYELDIEFDLSYLPYDILEQQDNRTLTRMLVRKLHEQTTIDGLISLATEYNIDDIESKILEYTKGLADAKTIAEANGVEPEAPEDLRTFIINTILTEFHTRHTTHKETGSPVRITDENMFRDNLTLREIGMRNGMIITLSLRYSHSSAKRLMPPYKSEKACKKLGLNYKGGPRELVERLNGYLKEKGFTDHTDLNKYYEYKREANRLAAKSLENEELHKLTAKKLKERAQKMVKRTLIKRLSVNSSENQELEKLTIEQLKERAQVMALRVLIKERARVMALRVLIKERAQVMALRVLIKERAQVMALRVLIKHLSVNSSENEELDNLTLEQLKKRAQVMGASENQLAELYSSENHKVENEKLDNLTLEQLKKRAQAMGVSKNQLAELYSSENYEVENKELDNLTLEQLKKRAQVMGASENQLAELYSSENHKVENEELDNLTLKQLKERAQKMGVSENQLDGLCGALEKQLDELENTPDSKNKALNLMMDAQINHELATLVQDIPKVQNSVYYLPLLNKDSNTRALLVKDSKGKPVKISTSKLKNKPWTITHIDRTGNKPIITITISLSSDSDNGDSYEMFCSENEIILAEKAQLPTTIGQMSIFITGAEYTRWKSNSGQVEIMKDTVGMTANQKTRWKKPIMVTLDMEVSKLREALKKFTETSDITMQLVEFKSDTLMTYTSPKDEEELYNLTLQQLKKHAQAMGALENQLDGLGGALENHELENEELDNLTFDQLNKRVQAMDVSENQLDRLHDAQDRIKAAVSLVMELSFDKQRQEVLIPGSLLKSKGDTGTLEYAGIKPYSVIDIGDSGEKKITVFVDTHDETLLWKESKESSSSEGVEFEKIKNITARYKNSNSTKKADIITRSKETGHYVKREDITQQMKSIRIDDTKTIAELKKTLMSVHLSNKYNRNIDESKLDIEIDYSYLPEEQIRSLGYTGENNEEELKLSRDTLVRELKKQRTIDGLIGLATQHNLLHIHDINKAVNIPSDTDTFEASSGDVNDSDAGDTQQVPSLVSKFGKKKMSKTAQDIIQNSIRRAAAAAKKSAAKPSDSLALATAEAIAVADSLYDKVDSNILEYIKAHFSCRTFETLDIRAFVINTILKEFDRKQMTHKELDIPVKITREPFRDHLTLREIGIRDGVIITLSLDKTYTDLEDEKTSAKKAKEAEKAKIKEEKRNEERKAKEEKKAAKDLEWTLKQTLNGHTDRVNSAAFSPGENANIVSASFDKTVRVWSAETGELLQTLEGHTTPVFSAAFSPGGENIVSASSDKTVRVWSVETGDSGLKKSWVPLRTLEGHSDWVTSAAFSPGGENIVSASDDMMVHVWSAQTGELLQKLEGHSGKVMSAAFSSDGENIVSASWDKTVCVWSTKTGELLHTLKGHSNGVRSAAFSPDGENIVSASDDKTVCVWSAETGGSGLKKSWVLLRTLEGHTSGVMSAAFSPKGENIVSASSDKTIRVWNTLTGVCLQTLKEHTDIVYSVQFSPDGQNIVSASGDKTVRTWQLWSATLQSELLNQSRIGIMRSMIDKCNNLAKIQDAIKYFKENPGSVRNSVEIIVMSKLEKRKTQLEKRKTQLQASDNEAPVAATEPAPAPAPATEPALTPQATDSEPALTPKETVPVVEPEQEAKAPAEAEAARKEEPAPQATDTEQPDAELETQHPDEESESPSAGKVIDIMRKAMAKKQKGSLLTEAEVEAAAAPEPATEPVPSTQAKSQWVRYYNNNSTPYYYNPITKKSVWNMPANGIVVRNERNITGGKKVKRKPVKRNPSKRKPAKRKPVAKRKVRKIYKGPRGGIYYITKGRKVYL